MSRVLYWYARAEGIAYLGPYASQVQAWDAVRGHEGTPAPGACVWCTYERIVDRPRVSTAPRLHDVADALLRGAR